MPAKPRTIRARKLRQDATEAEKQLWRALHDAALPWKFRRQHPVGRYVLDIAVVSKKLAVEVDGGQHVQNADRDATRTAHLQAKGWRVLRFWNNDVLRNTDGVVQEIATVLGSSPDEPG